MARQADGHNPYAVLKIKDYRYFISARLFITLAVQIQAVVVGWQIYDLTHDPLSLGLIGLAEAVPSILVALYAGHIADIVSRKKIIISAECVLLVCSSALLLFTFNAVNVIENLGVLPIYCVIFLSGIARGFMSPANFSFMPQLVPRELYKNAISWNSTVWQSAAVAGPAIGGLLYGFFGINVAYLADVALVILALFFYAMIESRPVPEQSETGIGVKEKLLAGLKFVFKNQLILSAITLDLFAVLFGGAVALLPIFAAEILKVGPQGLGLLRSAPAVGAVLMALYLTYYPVRHGTGKKMLYSVAGFGLCMIFFAISKSFWLSLFLLALSGMFDSVSVIIRSTLIHTLTPENMKGRVSAVNSIFIGSSNEIGAFESGTAARFFGVVPSVVIGGFATLVVVSITAWKSKTLRELDHIN